MANNTGNKKKNNSSGKKNNYNRKSNSSKKKANNSLSEEELLVLNYIVIIGALFLCVLLFLCNFGLIGDFGNAVSKFMFAVFGWSAYIFPILLIVIAFLWISKQSDQRIGVKIFAFIMMFLSIGILFELSGGITASLDKYDIKELLSTGADKRAGGGLISGSVGFIMNRYLEKFATVLITVMLLLISVFMICGKAVIEIFLDEKSNFRNTVREANAYRTERNDRRHAENERIKAENDRSRLREEKQNRLREEKQNRVREERESKNRLKEAEEAENILRMERKVSGVSMDTSLKNTNIKRDDMHEITFKEPAAVKKEVVRATDVHPLDNRVPSDIRIHTAHEDDCTDINNEKQTEYDEKPVNVSHKAVAKKQSEVSDKQTVTYSDRKYKFPPLNLLSKNEKSGGGSSRNELEDTAHKLEEALESFSVSAKVTDVSQGPSVTRYELEPAPGVKVNRITALADDLKLHLAAKDIRIEAPIPGKSAVGIEVPNTESCGVKLRELLEDQEFVKFSGNIAFAVGKDIAGKVIVADVAKMPHMLIAGSTGSGKSVCINTIIMSIIYKHDPKDVQLIMVDPKVVELNVYNGIPHLMIPVVTDPKKAAGALHWAVNEMTDRYKKFADLNVRDLKGYNKKVSEMQNDNSEYTHLPQIVIIVDELADLMMVAAKEVEEAICRLAQLARACGIHLILATQRPSVDVITGLIKANMPSRVAFAVSSGVDSRTILDMNGAEKLLGKGDMLFYPQGYTKPTRIQGAFVSDSEVADVVEFIKNQRLHNEYGEKAVLSGAGSTAPGTSGDIDGGSDEYDELFVMAGQFIIGADKASIGNLQRKFRIGFNRAARIMDQLCEAGVVGEEQGTKPREILMSEEQFENYIEENM